MDQAEKLRNIVRAQEAETTGTGARMITVTSGKGGVGKSSVSVNLAVQIQKLGQRVIILMLISGLPMWRLCLALSLSIIFLMLYSMENR